MSSNDLPRWDLTNVYPSLDSKEFQQDLDKAKTLIDNLETYLQENDIDPAITPKGKDPQALAGIVGGFLKRVNAASELAFTLRAYLYSFIATDSYNEEAKKINSGFEPLIIKLNQLEDVLFKGWLGGLKNELSAIIEGNETAKAHAFYLQEVVEQSQYMMSPAEEELAGELSLSGVRAWGKLQGEITSRLKWEIKDEDGKLEKLPMTAVINLRGHESETMRRRGYEAEMQAWGSVENQLAAALNGVIGAKATLHKRRRREDDIHASIDMSRIDRPTLEAMLSAMKESFPVFQKYFKAKAKRLGKKSLPWWDLFAPMGQLNRSFSYPEAQQYVLENFGQFSEELADFADTAFQKNWIDVSPRDGKRAGAFCMEVPGVDESRIMLNFEGNLDWVFTLAHELGHGFHNHSQIGKTVLQANNPMTLAETASIMCETIVTEAAIRQAKTPQEELAILETNLIGASQVVVDIYSRYLFETEVFKRRAEAELSAQEFNQIMESAQAETYGDALDEKYRHKYMWTWKPHYYGAGLSFYNYPYAFGLLFATGLYAIYQQRGPAFVAEYKDLLASTGTGTAADLAARFEIDLRSPDFWKSSLDVIGQRIERYAAL